MKLSIVTPVYHEQDNILRVLNGVTKHVKTPHELLVVYDTPDDPTCPVVERFIKRHDAKNIRLVRNNQGSGRGFMNALKTGFFSAKGEAVLVMMADLCDNPEDVDLMYSLLKEEHADVVCASRYMKGGKQIGSPLVKRTLSRLAGKSLYLMRRVPTHDVTNNFKLYRKAVLEDVEIGDQGGFEIAMSITLQAHRKGYAVRELPTTWRDRTAGEAKFNLKKVLPRYLKLYVAAFKKGPNDKPKVVNAPAGHPKSKKTNGK